MRCDPSSFWGRVRRSLPLMAALGLTLTCGGEVDDGGLDADSVPADTTAAVVGETFPGTTSADAPTERVEEARDTARGERTDTAGRAGEGRRPQQPGGADSVWIRMAAPHPDTALAGRFFVRVADHADPAVVAGRHGVEPIDVVTDGARAFYGELTWGQVESLAADNTVRSLAQQIEGEGEGLPRPRGVPVSDTGRG